MFEPEVTSFLESGCALIVGVVGADGRPYATRGWGLTVLSRADATVRVLLDADEREACSDLSATRGIAVTAANVPTLRSMQLKGRIVRVEAGADHDRDRAAEYCEAFFSDVHEIEGTARVLIDRLAPADVLAVIARIEESFDQTPGPAAGTPLASSTP